MQSYYFYILAHGVFFTFRQFPEIFTSINADLKFYTVQFLNNMFYKKKYKINMENRLVYALRDIISYFRKT